MTIGEPPSQAPGNPPLALPVGMQARNAWTRRLQRWSRPFPGARSVGLRLATPAFLGALAARRRTLHSSVAARGMGIWSSCAMDWLALAQQLAARCAGAGGGSGEAPGRGGQAPVQWKVVERTVVQHGAVHHAMNDAPTQARRTQALPADVQLAVHAQRVPPTRHAGEQVSRQTAAGMPARSENRDGGDGALERRPEQIQAPALPPLQYRLSHEQMPAHSAAPQTAAEPRLTAAARRDRPFGPVAKILRSPAAPALASQAGIAANIRASAAAQARTASFLDELAPTAPAWPLQFAAAATPQAAGEPPALGDLLYDQAMRGLHAAQSPALHLDMPRASPHAEPPPATASVPAGSGGGDFRQAASEPGIHRDDIEQVAARVMRLIQREQRREREAKGRI